MSTHKKFYFIFEVTCHFNNPTKHRYYIGKEITYDPKSEYIGEDTSYQLYMALLRRERKHFTKKILQVCSSEEELNTAYERYCSYMKLYPTKYYAVGFPGRVAKYKKEREVEEASISEKSSKSHLTWSKR